MHGYAARAATSPQSAAKGGGLARAVVPGVRSPHAHGHYGLSHAVGGGASVSAPTHQQPQQQSSWVPPPTPQNLSYVPPPAAMQQTGAWEAQATQQYNSMSSMPPGHGHSRNSPSPTRTTSPSLHRQSSTSGFQPHGSSSGSPHVQAVAVGASQRPSTGHSNRSGHASVQRPSSFVAPSHMTSPTQGSKTAGHEAEAQDSRRRPSVGHAQPVHRPLQSPTSRLRSPTHSSSLKAPATACATAVPAEHALGPRASPCASPPDSVRTPRQSQHDRVERGAICGQGLTHHDRHNLAQAAAAATAAVCNAVQRQSSIANSGAPMVEAEPVRRQSVGQPMASPKAQVAIPVSAVPAEETDAYMSRLNNREQCLTQREDSLRQQEEPLRQREAAVQQREDALQTAEQDLQRKQVSLQAAEKDLQGKHASLRQSEDELRLREGHVEKREKEAAQRDSALSSREKSCEELSDAVEAQRKRELEMSLREQRLNDRESRLAEREERFADREAGALREHREWAEQERAKQETWLHDRESRLGDWEAELRCRERDLRSDEEKLRNERKQLDERERRQREAANEAHVIKKHVLGLRNSRAERVSPRTSCGLETSLLSEFSAVASKENMDLRRQLEEQQDRMHEIKRNSGASFCNLDD
eukprot:TRINITY_DN23031_c0_g1_i1.p1 TRINITY_DN23031_c0_g1~~TRINITY_DN23031_c0_g1_i1.p1  ORF type:complete len:644 (-),score=142.81 TRINITY_DN23031_c0_g1_i1:137-2068(-)